MDVGLSCILRSDIHHHKLDKVNGCITILARPLQLIIIIILSPEVKQFHMSTSSFPHSIGIHCSCHGRQCHIIFWSPPLRLYVRTHELTVVIRETRPGAYCMEMRLRSESHQRDEKCMVLDLLHWGEAVGKENWLYNIVTDSVYDNNKYY
jgi:hypothetical protein